MQLVLLFLFLFLLLLLLQLLCDMTCDVEVITNNATLMLRQSKEGSDRLLSLKPSVPTL